LKGRKLLYCFYVVPQLHEQAGQIGHDEAERLVTVRAHAASKHFAQFLVDGSHDGKEQARVPSRKGLLGFLRKTGAGLSASCANTTPAT
jgi:hypothetical protein